jgi:hypothetical protein
MHYSKLVKAHKYYWENYSYDEHYNDIVALLKGKKSITRDEAGCVLDFLDKWQCRIPKTPQSRNAVLRAFNDLILPRFSRLTEHRLEDTDLEALVAIDDLSVKLSWLIHETYDHLLQSGHRIGNTAISKMLHIACPALFVMWDVAIREEYIGYNNTCGCEYAQNFLPEMRRGIVRAVGDYAKKHGMAANEVSDAISNLCNGRSLAKLADEYNYVTITAGETL